MDDETPVEAGVKREAENSTGRLAKKPRDDRLRECFTITPLESGGEKIVCKYCPDFNKTLQKFNPTKGREHLTSKCTGIDDGLRQLLLDTSQAAKKLLRHGGDPNDPSTTPAPTNAGTPAKQRRNNRSNRPSPAYISIHTDDTSLDITAPMVDGELIFRLAFPTDHLKLNFLANKNLEGAASCIVGFTNLRADASWTASMCSMTSEGTRAGPHCQWSLNVESSGELDGGMTRTQKVQQILKTLIMI